MKKYRMTQQRKETSKAPLPDNVLELLKAVTFVAMEADKCGIAREKIDMDMILNAVRHRKPDEYRFDMQ